MKKQLLTFAALLCSSAALAKINITIAITGDTTDPQVVVFEEDKGTFAFEAGPHSCQVQVTANQDGVSYSFSCKDEEKTVSAAWSEELVIPCEGSEASVTLVATQE